MYLKIGCKKGDALFLLCLLLNSFHNNGTGPSRDLRFFPCKKDLKVVYSRATTTTTTSPSSSPWPVVKQLRKSTQEQPCFLLQRKRESDCETIMFMYFSSKQGKQQRVNGWLWCGSNNSFVVLLAVLRFR